MTYARNSGIRIIWIGTTVAEKITTNQAKPWLIRSATIAKPTAAPMNTAMAGDTML